jgi:hypothetical protein
MKYKEEYTTAPISHGNVTVSVFADCKYQSIEEEEEDIECLLLEIEIKKGEQTSTCFVCSPVCGFRPASIFTDGPMDLSVKVNKKEVSIFIEGSKGIKIPLEVNCIEIEDELQRVVTLYEV